MTSSALTVTQATQLGRIEANTLSILQVLRGTATQYQADHAATITQIQAIKTSLSSGLSEIMAALAEIQADINGTEPDGTPAVVRFIVPTYRDIKTGKSLNMATSLLNDVISNVPLEFDNLSGAAVPAPSGGTITLSVVDASGAASSAATAAMGADGTSVDITPTPSDGSNTTEFTVMFEDMANADLKASGDFVFTTNTNAANVHFRTDEITTRPIGP